MRYRFASLFRTAGRTRHVTLLAVLFLAALSGGGPAAAQCFGPDGFDASPPPCCSPAQPMLPQFPAFTLASLDICWRDCALDSSQPLTAKWSMPVPAQTGWSGPICSVFFSNLRLYDSSSTLVWKGRMRLWYARTWIEIDNTGVDHQVWRFLVNGDLQAQPAAGAPPCPVPACAPAFGNRVRYTGYLDYALDCSTQAWDFAWALNHECDRFDHVAGYPRAGNFHADRSFNFIGPAAGFVISPSPGVESGTSVSESFRTMTLPVPGTVALCNFEEPLTTVAIAPIQQGCACATGSVPPQYSYADILAVGACGSRVYNTGPYPKGFISKGIGGWTNPAAYPGVEELRTNGGSYMVDDCFGVTRTEVYFGATTMGGWPAYELTAAGPGAPLLPTFVDQGNARGLFSASSLLNVAFLSDRILSINLP